MSEIKEIKKIKKTKSKETSKKELPQLEEILPYIPEEKYNLVSRMIEEARFMESQLATLKKEIEKTGVSEDYKNGKDQFGKKQSVQMTTYLQIFKSYSMTIRFLSSLMDTSIAEEDELIKFLDESEKGFLNA